jgi:hypothetical protein
MLCLKQKRKAQSTLEYAIVIFVVVAAVMALSVYFKRAIQGRGRQASDQIGEQFSPQTTVWNYTTESYSKTKEEVGTKDAGGEGATKSTLLEQQYQKRWGNETVGSWDEEYYPK